MTLFEIDQRILECIDLESGEIIDTEALEALQMTREKKFEGVALAVKEFNAKAKEIREEELKLAERRRIAERKAEGYKTWLSLQGESFETPRVAVSFRKSEAVDIAEDAKVPEEFQKIDIKIDKVGIKKALKAGVEIAGCSLVEKQNIQIK